MINVIDPVLKEFIPLETNMNTIYNKNLDCDTSESNHNLSATTNSAPDVDNQTVQNNRNNELGVFV